MKEIKKDIEGFWNENLCGKHFIKAVYPSKEFFEQYSHFRYSKEHHLNKLIEWESAKGKDVLEIGLGIGADAVRWAGFAKTYTGIDLTNEAVEATRLHLQYKGLTGKILKGSVKSLPFENNSFDLIYSHGVLHHIPEISKGLKELHRVLRSGGKIILMLYSKDSFNYWVRIQLLLRIKFLYEILKNKLGFRVSKTWAQHIINLSNAGWGYFSWNNWYHHCTDGPDCPIANIYHKKEITNIIENAGFNITKMEKAHFPLGGRLPKFERFLAEYIGFYQFIWAEKNETNNPKT